MNDVTEYVQFVIVSSGEPMCYDLYLFGVNAPVWSEGGMTPW